ncbi:MAG: hypothetical protein U0792_22275 [Gemmataceae bacterium]
MNPRERNLSILLIGLIMLGGGSLLGYFLVYSPLQDKRAAAANLMRKPAISRRRRAAFVLPRRRSPLRRPELASDINQAKVQYKRLLEGLLQKRG